MAIPWFVRLCGEVICSLKVELRSSLRTEQTMVQPFHNPFLPFVLSIKQGNSNRDNFWTITYIS